ncbi:hypothetical protein ACFWA9_32000 [Kitasatospora sp. NPDC059973]
MSVRPEPLLRRLSTRLAEQATIDDLYALRDTLPRPHTPPTTAR